MCTMIIPGNGVSEEGIPQTQNCGIIKGGRHHETAQCSETDGRLSAGMVGLAERIEGIDTSLLIREPFEPFRIDMILEDGQIVLLGKETSVHVLATPGIPPTS